MRQQKDLRKTFVRLITISLRNNNTDWRLQTCQIMTNVARILNSLVDYAIPLTCQPEKRRIVLLDSNGKKEDHHHHHPSPSCYCIQKTYTSDDIGGIPSATVENMIQVYEMLRTHQVPHVDQLLSVEGRRKRSKEEADENDDDDDDNDHCVVNKSRIMFGSYNNNHATTKKNKKCITTCRFGPIGRSYPPLNFEELLDALICVTETLMALHQLGWMHRDIRWANIFHAFQEQEQHDAERDDEKKKKKNMNMNTTTSFSNEWVLFDFEFAASSPQPSLGQYTLTTSNHAPEMIMPSTSTTPVPEQQSPQYHTTAVDIWALGYLIETANVDIPRSHGVDMEHLRQECMQDDPERRPTATQCRDMLQRLKGRPRSKEMEVQYNTSSSSSNE